MLTKEQQEAISSAESQDVPVDSTSESEEEVVEEEDTEEESTEESTEEDSKGNESEEVVEEDEKKSTGKPNRENSRVRDLNDRNKKLEDMLETVLSQQQAFQQNLLQSRTSQTEEEDDGVDPAVKAAYRRDLATLQARNQEALGNVLEALDETKAESHIPGYTESDGRVASTIQKFREQRAKTGKYWTRKEAYEYLVATGHLKAPTKDSGKQIVRSKVKVGIEHKTSATAGKVNTKKPFTQLTITEMEKRLEGKLV